MKTILLVLGAVVTLVLIFLLVLNRGMGAVRSTTIADIDLTQVADGTYHGRFARGRWVYAVEVTVRDGRIEEIKITESCTVPPALNRALVQKVLDEQSLQVDAVSGASINTRAFLKAVETALRP